MSLPQVSLQNLVDGRIQRNLGMRIGDYVRVTQGTRGIYIITGETPFVFDYDKWVKNGKNEYHYLHRYPANATNLPAVNLAPYFSQFHLSRVADGKMKPLKRPRSGYVKYAKVCEKVDKLILQAELADMIQNLNDRYAAIINFLP